MFAAAKKTTGAERWGPYHPIVIEVDLRDVPLPVEWKPGDPIKEIPRKKVHPTGAEVPPPKPKLDPLLDLNFSLKAAGEPSFQSPRIQMQGQDFSGSNPPDTVGDVGIIYYIQAVNGTEGALYTVFNKFDGNVAAGPFKMGELSDKGACSNGFGDPIVLFDSYSGRWLLSEFANNNNALCVYVSRTSDPITGGWYHYQFETPNFPDYPKYGVWTDAYYVATNEGEPSVYALEKEKMLLGLPADLQRITAEALSGFQFQSLTPCDPDGPSQPPSGSPFYFMRHRDDEAHNPQNSDPVNDYLDLYKMQVDWGNSLNTLFIGPLSIAISEFDSHLCGLNNFSCFSQPNSSVKLDPLREVIMHRLQYRNFGVYETLVGSFVTDVDGTDRGGVRWFELRKQESQGWGLFQEGTLAYADQHNRWMSSIAMDKSGNIALGYNVTSSVEAPGLRYAGRRSLDSQGAMPFGENILIWGSDSNSSNRYGDYAAMSVDPVGGCEFWFTGMYNETQSWSTYIASFRFDSCGKIVYVSSADNNCNGAAPCEKSLKTATENAEGFTSILVAQGDYGGPVAIGAGTNVIIGYTTDFLSTLMTAPVEIQAP